MRTFLACVLWLGIVANAGCALADRISGVSQARTIQSIGEPAEAVVLQVWDTGITVNMDPVVGLLVRIDRPDQPSYEVKIEKSLISRVHVPQVQPGSRVPVYIDRNDPTRVALGLYRY